MTYGISSYYLVARTRADGSRVHRIPLGPSTRGQTDLVIGGPILGFDERVYAYVNVHRSGGNGVLAAYSAAGEVLWTHRQDATEQNFYTDSTHVLGADGVLYLVVGRDATALAHDTGEVLWSWSLDVGANDPHPVVDTYGSLLIVTDDEQLVALRTSSPGLAPTAWPISGHDEGNTRTW